MAETQNLEFDFVLADDTFHVAVELPIAPVRPRRLLPLFQGVANMIVDASVADVKANGEEVSCKAGCGACCRQIVPVSGAEARQLDALVAAMPEPRRSEVRARFAAALSRLEAEGLLETARNANSLPDGADIAFARRYMALGIPCPFLEDESCSIHPERPAICREYLVTSPAEHCADASPDRVRPVPMRARLSRAMVALEAHRGQPVLLPMVTALEWTKNHASKEPSARPAKEWIGVVMQAMSKPT
jgi:Fe-S-cluster containining protein